MRRNKKNFLPALVICLSLWIALGLGFIYVEPELVKNVLIMGAYLPVIVLVGLVSFLSLALMLGNTRRGLVVGTGITTIVALRIYDLGNWLNIVLVVGLIIAIERYFSE